MPNKKLNDKIVSEQYLSGKSGIQLAEMYNVSVAAIYKSLRRTNTDRRGNEENKREYDVDEHVFDIIDTPEKAYWLGFLFADGFSNNNRVTLALKESDKSHIEKFKLFTKSEQPIRTGIIFNKKYKKKYINYHITIHSKYLSNRLNELGIIPKRPKFDLSELPEHLYRYWIAGLFDGDGSVSVGKQPRVIFCSSNIKVMEFVMDQLSPYTDKYNKRTKEKKVSTHGTSGIHSLYYNGENISREIYNYMYKDIPIYLERKKRKFEEFC